MALAKTRPHYNLVFAVLLLGIAAYALLQSMIVPVLSILIPALHTTQDTATWLMTAYLLSASVATPILGRIGDKVGKERMLVVTLVGLAVGSLLAAVTDSVSVMIVARVIQGLGGGVIPLAFGIIRDEFPAKKVPGAVGIASSMIAVGSGVGLVAAGPIVDHLSYHWLFWLPMIMTTIAAVAAVLFVPESPVRSPGSINWGASILLSAWLVALLLAVSKGAAWGWGSAVTLGLFAAAIVCALAWIVVELKSRTPLIDMRTMRFPAVWTTNLVAVLTGAAMYAMMTFLPQLLQTPKSVAGYGLSASITQSGIYMLPMSAAMFVVGFAVGPLSARIGAKAIVLIGSIVTTAALVLLAVGHDQSWEIYVAAGVIGVGIGLAFSAMPAIIVAAVPPAQTGAATGMNANVRTVGGAIGSAISGSLLASSIDAGHRLPADSGYTKIFWFLAGVAALAAVASVLIPKVHAHSASRLSDAEKPVTPEPSAVEALPQVLTAPKSALAGVGGPAATNGNGNATTNGNGDAATNGADWWIGGHLRRENGEPVSGGVLTLIDQRGQQVSRTTGGPGGAFRIDPPVPGTYVLIVSASGYQPLAVTVTAGARAQRLDLTLEASGELSGVVRRADRGEPIAGAAVTLTDPQGEVAGVAISGDDGAYVCRGVSAGPHTLVAVAENMRPTAITLTVPDNGPLRCDVELEPMAVLVGAVRAEGRAVPDAQVTVLDADGHQVAAARTDGSGNYVVANLPEGRYTVVARGYPPVTSTVAVTGGEITHDVRFGYDEVAATV